MLLLSSFNTPWMFHLFISFCWILGTFLGTTSHSPWGCLGKRLFHLNRFNGYVFHISVVHSVYFCSMFAYLFLLFLSLYDREHLFFHIFLSYNMLINWFLVIFCIWSGLYLSPDCWVGCLFFSVIWTFCFQATHWMRGVFLTLTYMLCNVIFFTCFH